MNFIFFYNGIGTKYSIFKNLLNGKYLKLGERNKFNLQKYTNKTFYKIHADHFEITKYKCIYVVKKKEKNIKKRNKWKLSKT